MEPNSIRTIMTGPTIQVTDEISLRPATLGDRELLLRIYECSRETELSMVPWDDSMKRAFVEHQFDAQTAYYNSHYPAAQHHIISLQKDRDVGRIYVNRSEGRISILDVTVLTAYRRQGVGSAVIASLTDEARKLGVPVQVFVETFNPSQDFFTKRGFRAADNDGFNTRLVWELPPKS